MLFPSWRGFDGGRYVNSEWTHNADRFTHVFRCQSASEHNTDGTLSITQFARYLPRNGYASSAELILYDGVEDDNVSSKRGDWLDCSISRDGDRLGKTDAPRAQPGTKRRCFGSVQLQRGKRAGVAERKRLIESRIYQYRNMCDRLW